MQIDLNLSNHAIGQLNLRYPNWKSDELRTALKDNPTFQDGDEFHTYLGTGFDIYEGSNNIPRKRYQRRHLFIVSKRIGENKSQWTQMTVVFHTHLALVRRVEKQATVVFNNDKRVDGDWITYAPKVFKLLSDDPMNSMRNDLQWNYADKLFITTNTLN